MERKSIHKNEEFLVSVKSDSIVLNGNLIVPDCAQSIVLFVYGSCSCRDNPRNRYVAHKLREAGLATLLIDILTQDEESIDVRTRHHLCFDIHLLASRLVEMTDWLTANPRTQNFRIGYFSAGTASSAALVAAAERPDVVGAIVSSGGRFDLAGSALSRVQAPTLLIVGGDDLLGTDMNQEALNYLLTEKRLEIIPRATNKFQELGTLEEMLHLASQWFKSHLTPPAQKNLHQHKVLV